MVKSLVVDLPFFFFFSYAKTILAPADTHSEFLLLGTLSPSYPNLQRRKRWTRLGRKTGWHLPGLVRMEGRVAKVIQCERCPSTVFSALQTEDVAAERATVGSSVC